MDLWGCGGNAHVRACTLDSVAASCMRAPAQMHCQVNFEIDTLWVSLGRCVTVCVCVCVRDASLPNDVCRTRANSFGEA
jgi:hypothetical protein